MVKVFLSAGHGGSDPGARANGLEEEVINLNALLACKAELERHGVEVVASRTTDADDPVSEEVNEANASGAEIAVSFHANAGGGDGWEAYYWSSDANGKRLAQLCEKHVKALGQNSRGCKVGDHLWFINSTDMTSVLVESFFLDNAADKAIGDTVEEQAAFGVAYAKAILEYLGIEYEEKGAEADESEETMAMDIREAVWGHEINGVRADELLAILGSTDDPTGRGVEMNTHDHVKWIAKKLTDVDAKLDALLAQKQSMVQ